MSTLFDYHNIGDDTAYSLYGATRWLYQTFTTSEDYILTSIKVLIYRSINSVPENITISIRNVDGAGKPTGSDIDGVTAVFNANGITDVPPGEWVELFLSEGIPLSNGTEYAIVMRVLTGSYRCIYWRCDADNAYLEGQGGFSYNAGSSWDDPSLDFMFECWGESGVSLVEGTGSVAIITTLGAVAKVSKKCSGSVAIITTLGAAAKIYKFVSGTVAIGTTLGGRAGTIRSVSGSIDIVIAVSGVGSMAIEITLGGYYRANNKKGYLATRITSSDSQLELQNIGYGDEEAKDRNIPIDADKLMRLVIWGIQYPNPSADPDREIVSAVWSGVGRVFNIIRAQEGTEAGEHFIGDNIALLFTAGMSSEILIFEDFEQSVVGSIAYTDDLDEDEEMEVTDLPPDNEVSEEGYRKILVSAGVGEAPYWQFIWADEVGGTRRV